MGIVSPANAARVEAPESFLNAELLIERDALRRECAALRRDLELRHHQARDLGALLGHCARVDAYIARGQSFRARVLEAYGRRIHHIYGEDPAPMAVICCCTSAADSAR